MRFVLPVPPSTNNLFANNARGKGSGRIPTRRYGEWKDEAGMMVIAQRIGKPMPAPPFEVEVWLYFADERKRDADNYHKAPQDLLAAVLGFEDDLVIDAIQRKRRARSEAGQKAECVVYLRHSDEKGEA